MLADDHEHVLIEPIAEKKDKLEKLYDFDLMEDGGHIRGWLVDGEEAAAFNARLTDYTANVGKKYEGLKGVPMVFAVGDGNHSLATAKSCYEELKRNHPGEDLSDHPARYALVELENIHDPAQVFEPIHRVVTGCDPKALRKALESQACAEGGFPVTWYAGEESGTVLLDRFGSASWPSACCRASWTAIWQIIPAKWTTSMTTTPSSRWQSNRTPSASCCPPWRRASSFRGRHCRRHPAAQDVLDGPQPRKTLLSRRKKDQMTTLTEVAFAKINLTLDVLDRREDGYHDIRSILQTVALRDDIELLLDTGTGWHIECETAGIPLDETNLAWRAGSRVL